MKELIQLLLAISLEKIQLFLNHQQQMKALGTKLAGSLLFTAALQKIDNLEPQAVVTFDPLAIAFEKYNQQMRDAWRNNQPEDAASLRMLNEDARIDILVLLLKNCSVLDELEKKVTALLELYENTGNFAAKMRMNSLYVAILAIKKGVSFDEIEQDTFLVSVVNTLQQENIEHKSTVSKIINDFDEVAEVYALLQTPEEKKWQAFLQSLDSLCIKLKAELQQNQSALMTESKEEDNILLLHACIYDKGKGAEERLRLFRDIFFSEIKFSSDRNDEVGELLQQMTNTAKKLAAHLSLLDYQQKNVWQKGWFFAGAAASYVLPSYIAGVAEQKQTL